MHCVSLYPARPDQANLARIPALARRFGLPVGLSDHLREQRRADAGGGPGGADFRKAFYY